MLLLGRKTMCFSGRGVLPVFFPSSVLDCNLGWMTSFGVGVGPTKAFQLELQVMHSALSCYMVHGTCVGAHTAANQCHDDFQIHGVSAVRSLPCLFWLRSVCWDGRSSPVPCHESMSVKMSQESTRWRKKNTAFLWTAAFSVVEPTFNLV